MSFSEAIKNVFDNYGNFNGRARRREFWYFFFLFNIGFICCCAQGLPEYFRWLFAAVLITPLVSVAVRRLHDTGKKGSRLLLAVVPVIGQIVVAVWLATEGDPKTNSYGKSPKKYEGKKL